MHTSYRPSGFVKPTLDVSGRCWIIRSRSGKDYSLTLGLVNWVKVKTRSISKKCWVPFSTASRRTPPFYIAIHQVSLLSHAACASMSTTTTTTTTTRDRGDRYGPMEWAQ